MLLADIAKENIRRGGLLYMDIYWQYDVVEFRHDSCDSSSDYLYASSDLAWICKEGFVVSVRHIFIIYAGLYLHPIHAVSYLLDGWL